MCKVMLIYPPGKAYQRSEDRAQCNLEESAVVTAHACKGTGFCYFTARALALLKMRYDETVNSPVDLCSYMNLLIQEQYTGLALRVAEKEFNINTAADLDDVQCGLRVI